MIQCSPVPKIAIAKQMNGPFSERVKKKGRGHTFIFHTPTNTHTHTYKKHTHTNQKTHTPTRVRAGSLRLILYIKREFVIC